MWLEGALEKALGEENGWSQELFKQWMERLQMGKSCGCSLWQMVTTFPGFPHKRWRPSLLCWMWTGLVTCFGQWDTSKLGLGQHSHTGISLTGGGGMWRGRLRLVELWTAKARSGGHLGWAQPHCWPAEFRAKYLVLVLKHYIVRWHVMQQMLTGTECEGETGLWNEHHWYF